VLTIALDETMPSNGHAVALRPDGAITTRFVSR